MQSVKMKIITVGKLSASQTAAAHLGKPGSLGCLLLDFDVHNPVWMLYRGGSGDPGMSDMVLPANNTEARTSVV